MAASPAAARPLPSIWAFIVMDCLGFSVFFAVFMSERDGHAALFDAAARQLDAGLGLVNTLILVTSGWCVALAMVAARARDLATTRQRLILAAAIGSGFAVIKLYEYGTKIAHGITPLSNDFYGYYFALTGVHFVHYLIGMGALVVTIRKLGAATTLDEPLLGWTESAGLFWHMVDLLWVFLFPMLYLLGGAA